ncbi:MAG: Histidine biosynthesis bifunctional protein hisB [Bogoriella megaspora]|nr:MAG: Histidine biosynthesis bifunctional protein hisB [Bogoriella megaspora]
MLSNIFYLSLLAILPTQSTATPTPGQKTWRDNRPTVVPSWGLIGMDDLECGDSCSRYCWQFTKTSISIDGTANFALSAGYHVSLTFGDDKVIPERDAECHTCGDLVMSGDNNGWEMTLKTAHAPMEGPVPVYIKFPGEKLLFSADSKGPFVSDQMISKDGYECDAWQCGGTILQNGQVRPTDYPNTTVPIDESWTTYSPNATEISYKGRWDDQYISWWSAPGLKFGFTGSAVAITFGRYTDNGNLIAYRYGGEDWMLTNVTANSTHQLITSSTPGYNLTAAGETRTFELRVSNWALGVQIDAIHLSSGGKLVKLPSYGKTVEVIGDSLSAGQFATLEGISSWAWGFGEGLGNVEFSIEAHPGICLTDIICSNNNFNGQLFQWFKTSDTSYRSTQIYPESQPDWDFSAHPAADLVVINIGTNDAGSSANVSAEQFENNYITFINRVHCVWPDAQIVVFSLWGGFSQQADTWVQGPTFEQAIENVVNAFSGSSTTPPSSNSSVCQTASANYSNVTSATPYGSGYVHYFNTTGILQHNDIGPLYHPTDVGHIKIASHLLQYVKLKFGWLLEATGPEVQHRTTLDQNPSKFLRLQVSARAMPTVHLLDYVAGNVRSLVNAIEKVGYTVKWIKSPADVPNAEKLILPGVGHFGHCLSQFAKAGYVEPIKKHIEDGKPFMGICVGLQALFEGSTESPDVPGLGIIPDGLKKFDDSDKSVPHIGWNSANTSGKDRGAGESLYGLRPDSKYYYVHSYAVPYIEGQLEKDGWAVATARHGNEEFVGAIAKDNIFATQFHPEKSGTAGLRVLKAFLDGERSSKLSTVPSPNAIQEGLTRRVIACLDVRTNDAGDLVVTKGDQYDVREKGDGVGAGGAVRNLGKPVDKAKQYYEQGADEVTFLNITSFRNCPVADLPMLEVLRRTSETVFVPLTIGGGIRDTVDVDGKVVSALDIATLYFKSGADKVSIGSDAVTAAEEYYAGGQKLTGKTAIETISKAYGNQAVVVSVDPKRTYVASPRDTSHHTIKTAFPGPNGEEHCWYQCTIKGGREGRDFDVRQLVQAVEAMGAGEILLNCIDKDGTNSGFDLELVKDVKEAVKIPVIASSGAGKPEHFAEVFKETTTDAALGAGIFHRGEYTVKQVKQHLREKSSLVRQVEE